MTLLTIKLFMGGMLKRLWEALSGAFAWARHNPALAAIIALSIALAGVWWVKSGQVEDANRRADKWHTAWTAMDTAQRVAMKLALAEKAAKEAAATQSKDNANAALKPSLVSGMAANDRYAVSNRCVRVGPDPSRRQHADLSGAIPVAGQPQGGGGEDAVAISERDLVVCTANTLRLDNAVNVWAADMVARGLAK